MDVRRATPNIGYPRHEQPGLPPWKLALVTVMQFAEDLSDRRAADAVRGRIDWKYALGLELDDPGFDFSVLSEFRGRLRRRGRTAPPGRDARSLQGPRPAQGPGPPAHRLDPRPGRHPRPQPPGVGRRDAPRRPQRTRGGRAGVAPSAGPARVVRPLRGAGGGDAPAQGPGGPLRTRGGHRHRRIPPPGRPPARRGVGLAVAGPRGRGPA